MISVLLIDIWSESAITGTTFWCIWVCYWDMWFLWSNKGSTKSPSGLHSIWWAWCASTNICASFVLIFFWELCLLRNSVYGGLAICSYGIFSIWCQPTCLITHNCVIIWSALFNVGNNNLLGIKVWVKLWSLYFFYFIWNEYCNSEANWKFKDLLATL